MSRAFLNRIGTAVPEYDIHGEFVEFARTTLPDERSQSVFERMRGLSDIEHRYSFMEPGPLPRDVFLDRGGFYERGQFPSTGARMARFEPAALALATQAAERLGIGALRGSVTHLIVASCTGFSAPGLDLHLGSALGLSSSVERTMIGFMGCFAAVNALKLARHIVRSEPAARVLVVNVELSSLHLQEQWEIEKMLMFLLFADGCSACLVSAEPEGIELGAFRASVIPDSQELITWHIRDNGFDMHLSGQVPARIRALARSGRPRGTRPARSRQCRPLGGARRRTIHPGCGAAGAGAWPGRAAVLAPDPARVRQHVVGDPDVRSRPDHAHAGHRGQRPRGGLRSGAERRDVPLSSGCRRVNLAHRSTEPERMDLDCVDYADYRRCLRDLSRVNRTTFTGAPTLRWLGRQGLRAGDRFSLLDVACGYGDMLRRIRRWSERRGIEAELVGIDLNPWAVRAAREATPEAARITYRAGDVFAFVPDRAFDFIVSSQFTHHLTEEAIVAFVRWMERHASRGWLISDLQRSRLAQLGFQVLARAARWHHFVLSDGLISIARGFRPSELLALASAAEPAGPVAIRRHVPFRLTVSRPG